jgi:hypothetical protein
VALASNSPLALGFRIVYGWQAGERSQISASKKAKLVAVRDDISTWWAVDEDVCKDNE